VPARAAILALGACLAGAFGGCGASGREADAGTTFLDEGARGWKVSVAGCTPTSPDLPYDCVLED
jgi:hypothetical protein